MNWEFKKVEITDNGRVFSWGKRSDGKFMGASSGDAITASGKLDRLLSCACEHTGHCNCGALNGPR